MSATIVAGSVAQRPAACDTASSEDAEYRAPIKGVGVGGRPMGARTSGERGPDAPVPVLGAEGARDREGRRGAGATAYNLYVELI